MDNKICIAVGCFLPVVRKDYCAKHYARFVKHGDPYHTTGRPKQLTREELKTYIEENCISTPDSSHAGSRCWIWQGAMRKGRNVPEITHHYMGHQVSGRRAIHTLYFPDVDISESALYSSCGRPRCLSPFHITLRPKGAQGGQEKTADKPHATKQKNKSTTNTEISTETLREENHL